MQTPSLHRHNDCNIKRSDDRHVPMVTTSNRYSKWTNSIHPWLWSAIFLDVNDVSKRRQALCGVASFVECLMGKISCILLLQRMTLVCLLVCLLSFHNLDQRGRRVHSILCIRINDGFQQAYRIGVECNLTMKIHCTRFTLNTALYILSDILATMAFLFLSFFWVQLLFIRPT